MPSDRPWIVALLGALIALPAIDFSAAAASANPADDARGAAVKVAFVYNFAKFAEWPDGRFRSAGDPVVLCTQRDDLDASALLAIAGRPVGTHPVRIEILDPGMPIAACHIFFASRFASDSELQDVIALARRTAILLVSDSPGFAGRGGHIGLVEDRNRLRFQVNLLAVMDAGMRLSSKLLQLAEIVGGRRE